MIKLRVPCKESFAFIEEDYEGDNPKERYEELYALMNAPRTPDSGFIDELIAIVRNNLVIKDIEKYEAYTPKQKEILREIKNLLARAVDKYKK